MRIIVVFLFTLLTVTNWAQRPSELAQLKSIYSEYDFVIVKDQTDVSISLHDEKGVEIIKTIQLNVYLTSDRAGFYKDDRVYSSFFERLLDKEAYALNKKTGKDKYKKEKVRDFDTKEAISEEVFFDDGTVTYFTYDGLKEESVMNLKYTKEVTDPHFSISGFFGSSYPLLNKSVTITVEDGIDLSTVYFNMDSTDVNYSVEKGRKETTYKWQTDTVDIYESEPSSPNRAYFVPHFISRINYYLDNKSQKVKVLESVKDLYSWYETLIDQVKCDNKEELQSIVDEIILAEDTELEKVKKVFQWVQGNVKYIAIEDGLGGFIPRDPSLVLSRRYGDCKDMSTLIVELLEIQNINAYQVWIGTTDIPYTYEKIPSPVVDNHMIAAYYDKQSDKYIFLDATDDQLIFGYPSSFIQGKEALINVEDGFEIVEVPILSAEKTAMIDSAKVSIENDKLVGNGKLQLTGYYAVDFKHLLKRANTKKRKKSQVESITKKGSNKYRLDSYNIDLQENEVTYNYEFTVPSYINRTKDEIYVNMSLDLFLDFFDSYEEEDRKTGVTEQYATQTNYVYTLKIPEGYKVDYVPENLSVDEGDDFYVNINYINEKAGEITYSCDLFLDYILLDADRVPEMKVLGKKLKNAYKETIILKKIKNDENK